MDLTGEPELDEAAGSAEEGAASAAIKQVFTFLRQVLPRDLTQLLFLAGCLLLMINVELRCRLPEPPGMSFSEYSKFFSVPGTASLVAAWLTYSSLCRVVIFFAGIAGLYSCFRPGKRGAWRVLILPCAPAVASVLTLSVLLIELAANPHFPGTIASHGTHNELWAFDALWQLGPGYHVSVIGTLLVVLFELRFAMGLTSLPLEIAQRMAGGADDEVGWKRIGITVWASIALAPLFVFALDGVAAWDKVIGEGPSRGKALLLITIAAGYAIWVVLIVIAAWSVGKSGRALCVWLLRPRRLQFGMLAIAIPAAVNQLPGLAACGVGWLRAKNSGVATAFGSLLRVYLRVPLLGLFWALPGAALEEVVWRGLLQPVFIKRFGVMRGIFLIGVVWSAFHFGTDFRGQTDAGIVIGFVTRLALCISMSYVLGWLTLKSGSLWPAMLLHGIHNVCSATIPYLENAIYVPTRLALGICYALVGYVLFRFWPPEEMRSEIGTPGYELNAAKISPREI